MNILNNSSPEEGPLWKPRPQLWITWAHTVQTLNRNLLKLTDWRATPSILIAELWRAKRACGAPWVSKSTHPRKFGNHVIVHRPQPARPSVRTTGIPMFTLTLSSQVLSSYLGAQEKADCTSMLSSIDSCQNRVSADQYHLTVSRAQKSTHEGRVFFWSYLLTIYLFSNDRRLTFTFF